MHFDFAVVGNGLMGAAALLALSKGSGRGVGFSAPYGAGSRYYSSHEDDSRLVRTHHDDLFWERLTTRNLQEMRHLEEQSGLTVFRPLPVYYRFRGGTVAPAHRSFRPLGPDSGAAAAFFDAEDARGGIVHPKEYIRAMNTLAAERGVEVRPTAVSEIIRSGGTHRLVPREGDSVTADVVINARGVFSENELRTGRVTVAGKILIYTEGPRDAERGTFCFIDSRPDTPVFKDFYGFFQYRTEGGREVSKFGFTESSYRLLRDQEEIARWFQGGYRDYPHLQEALRCIEVFTGGRHRVRDIKPCAFAVTPDGKPLVTREDNLITMTGCNGSLAKCNQAFVQDTLRQLELI